MTRLKIVIPICLILLVAFQSGSRDEFAPYTQTIPDAEVTFDMVPIPGGEFMMGYSRGR